MPYLKTSDDVELFYNDWGTGAPVVLIHGWPLTSAMWEKQATFLAEHGLRVISYDRRGCGRSGQPWSGYDYDTLAADLKAVLEGLDLQEATLVGFSMGGGEVARYLSRYGSARVARAVLLAAVTPYLLKTEDNPEGVDGSVFEEIAGQVRKDRPAFLESFGPKFFGRSVLHPTVSDAVLGWTGSLAMSASLRATLEEAKAWSGTDFRGDLAKIDVPVRVIHGTRDETVPMEVSARRAVKLLAKGTLSEYEGEPHGLFWTAADRVNAELLAFIGK